MSNVAHRSLSAVPTSVISPPLRLGIAMTPDRVTGILDYWTARSQLVQIRPGVYRRPLEPDDAA
ncbi:hypothetical protein [Nocardia sp. NBC_01327]|uniref:hypothetical protein n=1 Tax=Nocardia sp. NBC_01327 TaxID=2903593 RepID=UPI002E12550F|nr:hypothetical protein OG326_42125 [Nocardia sp. NBC_01327]